MTQWNALFVVLQIRRVVRAAIVGITSKREQVVPGRRFGSGILGSFWFAVLIAVGLPFKVMNNGAILLALIAPHIALGIAWTKWVTSPVKFETPRVRTILLFTGIIACSLSIALSWALAVSKSSETFERAADVLIVFAMFAGCFGKGSAQLPLILAGMAGLAIWITGHIGVL